jgi:hypothetical protein
MVAVATTTRAFGCDGVSCVESTPFGELLDALQRRTLPLRRTGDAWHCRPNERCGNARHVDRTQANAEQRLVLVEDLGCMVEHCLGERTLLGCHFENVEDAIVDGLVAPTSHRHDGDELMVVTVDDQNIAGVGNVPERQFDALIGLLLEGHFNRRQRIAVANNTNDAAVAIEDAGRIVEKILEFDQHFSPAHGVHFSTRVHAKPEIFELLHIVRQFDARIDMKHERCRCTVLMRRICDVVLVLQRKPTNDSFEVAGRLIDAAIAEAALDVMTADIDRRLTTRLRVIEFDYDTFKYCAIPIDAESGVRKVFFLIHTGQKRILLGLHSTILINEEGAQLPYLSVYHTTTLKIFVKVHL